MLRLTDLPNELLEQICLHIWPSDLLNAVLSCKALHNNARKALDKHELRLLKYPEIDDRNGLFMPEFLCDVLDDRSLGWYVRKAVLWIDRKDFSEWVKPKLHGMSLIETREAVWQMMFRDLRGNSRSGDESSDSSDSWETEDEDDDDDASDDSNVTDPRDRRHVSGEGSDSLSIRNSAFRDYDEYVQSLPKERSRSRPTKPQNPSELASLVLSTYAQRLQDFLILEIGLSKSTVEDWFEDIRDGYDRPIKAIVCALCPRLQTIVFVQQFANGAGEKDLPQALMEDMIRCQYPSSVKDDPVIFTGLENVSLQYNISIEWDAFGNFGCQIPTTMAFCSLPSLKRLSVHEINNDQSPLGRRNPSATIFERFHYPHFEPNVEVLYLDFVNRDMEPKLFINFIEMFHKLKVFNIKEGLGEQDQLLSQSLRNSSSTLQEIQISPWAYADSAHSILGSVVDFISLKHLGVSVQEFIDAETEDEWLGIEPPWIDPQKLLPPSLETLTIRDYERGPELPGILNGRTDVLSFYRHFAKFLKESSTSHKRLKGLCFREMSSLREPWANRSFLQDGFTRVIVPAARERRIHISFPAMNFRAIDQGADEDEWIKTGAPCKVCKHRLTKINRQQAVLDCVDDSLPFIHKSCDAT